jgi:cyclopropane-fatty-acyl-phospholipid synthase
MMAPLPSSRRQSVLNFQARLKLIERWQWNGRHYEQTANAWLANMDRKRDRIWPILEQTYGVASARTWWMRWRVFFMACAELFGYRQGEEWQVGHYLFERPGEPIGQRSES